ncbi:MAG: YkgJ family cysteine cluster protein [Candidatus Ranarchaeia archaeon]
MTDKLVWEEIDNGDICLKNCESICCRETKMMLSESDVKRIIKNGFEKDFFLKIEDGWFFLKNNNEKKSCVFLSKIKCLVYDSRPQGCKYYPLIWSLPERKCIPDIDCPLSDSISKETINKKSKELEKFIQILINERKIRLKK